jgi:CMP-N,N'-diacetyllegionaminic acid synthase
MTIKGIQVIAIVPARAGSKGVLGKNMRLVNGFPLVGYTLEAALNSKYIDQVYLTSDDQDILMFGEQIGATGVKRPPECATDNASANDVVKHLLSTIPEIIEAKDPLLIYLQPTSPLRTAIHIDDSLLKMVEAGCSQLISVTEMEKSPFKAFYLDERGKLKSLFEEKMTNACRQDIPVAYLPNGAIYIFFASQFFLNNTIPSNGSYPYIMTKKDSLDIDTENDFNILTSHLSS